MKSKTELVCSNHGQGALLCWEIVRPVSKHLRQSPLSYAIGIFKRLLSRRTIEKCGFGVCWLLLAVASLGAAEKRKRTVFEVDKRFQELDRDRDGKVSTKEFPQDSQFRLIDTNHDGFISLEEARNHFIAEPSKASENLDATETASKTKSEAFLRQRFRILKPAEHAVGRIVPDVLFRDIDGVEHHLSEFKSYTAMVVAVTSTSCPLSKRFLPTLARIEKIYSKEVRFVFVNSTVSDEDEAIRTAIQKNALKGPYVRDPEGTLLASVGAMSTTDCFVIDKSLTLRYRGAVDDQYGLGYSLGQPGRSLLVDALDAVLSGRTPDISATDAPGCLLSFAKPATTLAPKKRSVGFTYHNRISRIIQSNCVECHHEGGAAPFSLAEPTEVEAHAAMIAQVVKTGTMPPWFAAPATKNHKNVWANDRSLVASDKSDLLNWLSSDRPLGDLADAPVPLTFSTGWQLGEPDAIVQLPTPIAVSAEGVMPYQQVVVETDLDEDKWVRGFDIRPSARDVVHHVGVFVESGPMPEQKGDKAENSGGYLALYVPGNSWRLFPDGSAKSLPKGSRLRFQIHYTPNGTATEDRTQLGLYFSKRPPIHELRVTGVLNRDIIIPPNAHHHKESGWLAFSNDVQIISFLPHMHVRGKAFRFEAISKAGVPTTLLDVPRYDFNWQLAYHLAEPYSLPKGMKLTVRGWFDNSARNPANPDPTQTVLWGPQTHEEMLLGYVEYIVPAESPHSKGR